MSSREAWWTFRSLHKYLPFPDCHGPAFRVSAVRVAWLGFCRENVSDRTKKAEVCHRSGAFFRDRQGAQRWPRGGPEIRRQNFVFCTKGQMLQKFSIRPGFASPGPPKNPPTPGSISTPAPPKNLPPSPKSRYCPGEGDSLGVRGDANPTRLPNFCNICPLVQKKILPYGSFRTFLFRDYTFAQE